jgi:hypothetical protein
MQQQGVYLCEAKSTYVKYKDIILLLLPQILFFLLKKTNRYDSSHSSLGSIRFASHRYTPCGCLVKTPKQGGGVFGFKDNTMQGEKCQYWIKKGVRFNTYFDFVSNDNRVLW